MNKRIKELAKQAAVVYQKTLPPATHTTHTTPLYLMDKLGKDAKDAGIKIISDRFCEKFAELIMTECIVALAPEVKSEDDAETVNNMVQNVKQHFGIEE